MNLSSFRAALVAVVTAAVVVIPAVSAHAQTQTIKDVAGDTWEFQYDEQADQMTWEATGTQPDVDVAKMVVRHTNKKISLTTVYHSLDQSSDALFATSQLRTGRGSYFVEFFSDHETTDVSLSSKRKSIRCTGLKASLDSKRETLTISVPRTCLDKPQTVQVRSVAYAGFSDPESPNDFEGHHFYLDAIGKDGHGIGPWSKKLKKG